MSYCLYKLMVIFVCSNNDFFWEIVYLYLDCFLVWQEAKIISVRNVKKKKQQFSLAIQTQREIAIDLYWIFEARLKMLLVSKATQWILFLMSNKVRSPFVLSELDSWLLC